LSLVSVIHFVCHFKSMLSYIHHCVYEVKILGVHYDHKLTWCYKIDQLAAHSHQRLGAILCTRDHLGQSGQVTTYKSFVCPICEYGNVVFMELLPHFHIK